MSSAAGALRALQTLSSSFAAGSSSLRQAARRPAHLRTLHRSAGVCLAAKQVEISHILLPADQKGLLPELRRRVEAGEPLAALAAEHSKCPSRGNGGALGWISRGQTVQEFEEAAFATPPGGLAVCETRFGVHLVQVTAEREAAEVQAMSPQELAESLSVRAAGGNEDVQYIDVREEGEQRLASLPHFQLLPLSQFDSWSPTIASLLDKERETVCLCHHGVRSMQMAQWLIGQGFTNVKNVTGGIALYSQAVDPSVPQY